MYISHMNLRVDCWCRGYGLQFSIFSHHFLKAETMRSHLCLPPSEIYDCFSKNNLTLMDHKTSTFITLNYEQDLTIKWHDLCYYSFWVGIPLSFSPPLCDYMPHDSGLPPVKVPEHVLIIVSQFQSFHSSGAESNPGADWILMGKKNHMVKIEGELKFCDAFVI